MNKVYAEVLEYLAEHVEPEVILNLKPSGIVQARADELTDLNEDGRLSVEDAKELEDILELSSLITMLKAQALKAQREVESAQKP